jgi:hypothetical protein
MTSQDAMSNSPQRILAFELRLPETGAFADGPCGRRRCARPARAFSAQSLHLERPRHRGDGLRAIGVKPLCGSVNSGAYAELAESNLRCRTLPERSCPFATAAAALLPIWAKSAEGTRLHTWPMCGLPGRKRRGYASPQPRTPGERPARRDEPGAERHPTFSAAADRGRRRAARRRSDAQLGGGSAGSPSTPRATALRDAWSG